MVQGLTNGTNELATLLERNKHKFIFYRYYGGMGGEFIMHYIADNSPNIIIQNDKEWYQGMNNVPEQVKRNKFAFPDTIFCHYFQNSAQKSYGTGADKTNKLYWRSLCATTFVQLANNILNHLDTYRYRSHDFHALHELDKHEDMRYLVKLHNLYDELKLFKGAKIIRTHPDEWISHCDLLTFMKNDTNYNMLKSDKLSRIRNIMVWADNPTDPWLDCHPYNSKNIDTTPSSMETIVKYLYNIIENDHMPLYDHTIWIAMQPDNYAISLTGKTLDILTIPAEEINNVATYLELFFKEMEPGHRRLLPKLSHPYDITDYTFDEIANGEWITHEFELDAEEFRNAFDNWFNKNIELLNKLGVTDLYIPKKLGVNKHYIPKGRISGGIIGN